MTLRSVSATFGILLWITSLSFAQSINVDVKQNEITSFQSHSNVLLLVISLAISVASVTSILCCLDIFKRKKAKIFEKKMKNKTAGTTIRGQAPPLPNNVKVDTQPIQLSIDQPSPPSKQCKTEVKIENENEADCRSDEAKRTDDVDEVEKTEPKAKEEVPQADGKDQRDKRFSKVQMLAQEQLQKLRSEVEQRQNVDKDSEKAEEMNKDVELKEISLSQPMKFDDKPSQLRQLVGNEPQYKNQISPIQIRKKSSRESALFGQMNKDERYVHYVRAERPFEKPKRDSQISQQSCTQRQQQRVEAEQSDDTNCAPQADKNSSGCRFQQDMESQKEKRKSTSLPVITLSNIRSNEQLKQATPTTTATTYTQPQQNDKQPGMTLHRSSCIVNIEIVDNSAAEMARNVVDRHENVAMLDQKANTTHAVAKLLSPIDEAAGSRAAISSCYINSVINDNYASTQNLSNMLNLGATSPSYSTGAYSATTNLSCSVDKSINSVDSCSGDNAEHRLTREKMEELKTYFKNKTSQNSVAQGRLNNKTDSGLKSAARQEVKSSTSYNSIFVSGAPALPTVEPPIHNAVIDCNPTPTYSSTSFLLVNGTGKLNLDKPQIVESEGMKRCISVIQKSPGQLRRAEDISSRPFQLRIADESYYPTIETFRGITNEREEDDCPWMEIAELKEIETLSLPQNDISSQWSISSVETQLGCSAADLAGSDVDTNSCYHTPSERPFSNDYGIAGKENEPQETSKNVSSLSDVAVIDVDQEDFFDRRHSTVTIKADSPFSNVAIPRSGAGDPGVIRSSAFVSVPLDDEEPFSYELMSKSITRGIIRNKIASTSKSPSLLSKVTNYFRSFVSSSPVDETTHAANASDLADRTANDGRQTRLTNPTVVVSDASRPLAIVTTVDECNRQARTKRASVYSIPLEITTTANGHTLPRIPATTPIAAEKNKSLLLQNSVSVEPQLTIETVSREVNQSAGQPDNASNDKSSTRQSRVGSTDDFVINMPQISSAFIPEMSVAARETEATVLKTTETTSDAQHGTVAAIEVTEPHLTSPDANEIVVVPREPVEATHEICAPSRDLQFVTTASQPAAVSSAETSLKFQTSRCYSTETTSDFNCVTSAVNVSSNLSAPEPTEELLISAATCEPSSQEDDNRRSILSLVISPLNKLPEDSLTSNFNNNEALKIYSQTAVPSIIITFEDSPKATQDDGYASSLLPASSSSAFLDNPDNVKSVQLNETSIQRRDMFLHNECFSRLSLYSSVAMKLGKFDSVKTSTQDAVEKELCDPQLLRIPVRREFEPIPIPRLSLMKRHLLRPMTCGQATNLVCEETTNASWEEATDTSYEEEFSAVCVTTPASELLQPAIHAETLATNSSRTDNEIIGEVGSPNTLSNDSVASNFLNTNSVHSKTICTEQGQEALTSQAFRLINQSQQTSPGRVSQSVDMESCRNQAVADQTAEAKQLDEECVLTNIFTSQQPSAQLQTQCHEMVANEIRDANKQQQETSDASEYLSIGTQVNLTKARIKEIPNGSQNKKPSCSLGGVYDTLSSLNLLELPDISVSDLANPSAETSASPSVSCIRKSDLSELLLSLSDGIDKNMCVVDDNSSSLGHNASSDEVLYEKNNNHGNDSLDELLLPSRQESTQVGLSEHLTSPNSVITQVPSAKELQLQEDVQSTSDENVSSGCLIPDAYAVPVPVDFASIESVIDTNDLNELRKTETTSSEKNQTSLVTIIPLGRTPRDLKPDETTSFLSEPLLVDGKLLSDQNSTASSEKIDMKQEEHLKYNIETVLNKVEQTYHHDDLTKHLPIVEFFLEKSEATKSATETSVEATSTAFDSDQQPINEPTKIVNKNEAISLVKLTDDSVEGLGFSVPTTQSSVASSSFNALSCSETLGDNYCNASQHLTEPANRSISEETAENEVLIFFQQSLNQLNAEMELEGQAVEKITEPLECLKVDSGPIAYRVNEETQTTPTETTDLNATNSSNLKSCAIDSNEIPAGANILSTPESIDVPNSRSLAAATVKMNVETNCSNVDNIRSEAYNPVNSNTENSVNIDASKAMPASSINKLVDSEEVKNHENSVVSETLAFPSAAAFSTSTNTVPEPALESEPSVSSITCVQNKTDVSTSPMLPLKQILSTTMTTDLPVLQDLQQSNEFLLQCSDNCRQRELKQEYVPDENPHSCDTQEAMTARSGDSKVSVQPQLLPHCSDIFQQQSKKRRRLSPAPVQTRQKLNVDPAVLRPKSTPLSLKPSPLTFIEEEVDLGESGKDDEEVIHLTLLEKYAPERARKRRSAADLFLSTRRKDISRDRPIL